MSCLFVPDRPPSSDPPSSCVSPSTKDTDSTQTSFPRLRRGRWRADEARLDLWGFATPSPPPPPPPMPPPPPPPPSSASLPSAQAPRRPRGRPRSTPLPERTSPGRGRASEGDAACHKKRRRYRSKKYQTGEYITERDRLEEGEHLGEEEAGRQDSTVPAGTHLLSGDPARFNELFPSQSLITAVTRTCQNLSLSPSLIYSLSSYFFHIQS